MHDDEGFDSEDQKGKLFYSGINPDADRADYALPRGEPALHDGDVEFEIEDPPISTQIVSAPVSQRVPRHKLRAALLHVGLSLSASILFCAGFVLGWSPGSSSDANAALNATALGDPIDASLFDWATKLAVGPIPDLIRYQKPFLAVVEMQAQPENTRLWLGVERLSRVAIVESPEERPDMIRSILQVIALPLAPGNLRERERDLKVALAEALEGK